MNTLEKIKKNHKENFLPEAKKMQDESLKLQYEITFSTDYESEYIIFDNYTYWVEKVENGIVTLYDETLDKYINKNFIEVMKQQEEYNDLDFNS